MKISCYGYIFNATLRQFDIEKTIENFCIFFDEVILSTIKSEDDTRERLAKLESLYPKLKIIESDITTEDNRFDGKLKTLAMKSCTSEIKVIVDCDERFILKQRPLWDKYAEKLLLDNSVDGYLIPVIDLFKSEETIRANSMIGQKFRMHKNTVVKRGVLPQAELSNGLFRTDLSDSTEPLLDNGQLAKFGTIVNQMDLNPMFCDNLANQIYVLHYGSLDLERRAKIGREFWKQKWSERSGHEENVFTSIKELENQPTIYHNLPIL
jgi:hypothetical protein